MKRHFQKSTVLSCCFLMSAFLLAATPNQKVSSQTQNKERFLPGADSYRVSFELQTARRYATRYLKETRTLQIRVVPARAKEFDASQHYDTQYVNRVVIEEQNSDVIINLQLKNAPLGWMVTSQNNPWRLLVDIWRTEPFVPDNLSSAWNWQSEASSLKPNGELASDTKSENNVPAIKPNVEQAVAPLALPATSVSPINAAEQKSKDTLPENFGRIDIVVKTESNKLADLQRRVGLNFGAESEFDTAVGLAEQLYKNDMTTQATNLFRRVAAISEVRFKEEPRTLWLAAESAYLSKAWDLSTDYLRALVLKHPRSEYASLGKLRLLDIEFLSLNMPNSTAIPEKIANQYAELALAETSTWQAKIAATLRVLHGHIDLRPTAANMYQQNLGACVTRSLVTFELRKNCAYIQTRNALEKSDILSADAEILRFKSFVPNDPRTPALEQIVQASIRAMLEESMRNKNWESWLQFEKKARAPLLEFSLKEPKMVFARAESWENAGEPKKAATLYSLYSDQATDDKQKDEANAIVSKLSIKARDNKKANLYLNRLTASDSRKDSGLSDRALAAVRDIALPPYRNKTALRIVMDEISAGRFVERDLQSMIYYAQENRGNSFGDSMIEKIVTYPPRNDNENKTVEETIMKYADYLRNTNKNSKAGEVYMQVANLNKSEKRAEAAYKAGLSFSRAGLLEKARSSWQMAAGDLNDKRYAPLARERLETLR